MALHGRDDELTVIDGCLDALADGDAGFLLVSGEPGIGKSTLLGALADRAAERGFRVLSGRATEFERGLPFGVLVDALDDHLAELDGERLARMGVERHEELAVVFPALDRAGGASAGTVNERYHLHRAVGGLLAGLAASRPLVVVLDDLHWGDEATLDTLAALVRRPPDGRVLVAGGHRSDAALDELAHQLDRHGHPRLRLRPLADGDAARLLAERVPARERDALVAQAGGNPFYLEQLARSPAGVAGRGVGGDRDGQVPAAIAASIRQEVERLSPDTRLLLQGAAVVGQPADLQLAGVAAGIGYDTALELVDEALAAELLTPAHAATAFSFRHPLVRRAVYELSGPGWRIAAHGRLRRALTEIGADVTSIAHHVEHGATLGDDEGIELLVAAADRVVDRAPADAAAWLSAALRLLPEEQSERRAGLEERRGAALLAAGDLAGARDALLAAGVDTAQRCWRLAEVERWLGLEQEAARRLEQARGLAGGDEPLVQAKVGIERMLIHEWNLRYDRAREAATAAQRAAAASGDPVAIAEVDGVMSTTLVQTDPRAAVAYYERAAAAMASYDDHAFPAHPMSLWDLGWTATYLERFEDAVDHFDRGLRIARARRAPGNVSMFLTDRAEPHFRAGRVRLALELAEEAVEAARATPSPRFLWWALVRLGLVLGRAGDGRRAAETMAECERVAGLLPPSPLLRLWTAQGRAAAAFALGEPGAAARLLADAAGGRELPLVAPVDRTRARLTMAAAAIAVGDVGTADRWAREGEEWAGHCGLPAQRAWALSVRAAVAGARGDHVRAASAAADAAEAFAQAGCALEAERAWVTEGRWLAELGDRSRAVELLESAEARLHELGAESDHAAVVRELRRLGRRTARRLGGAPNGGAAPAGGPLAALSAREREVAELAAAGATNRDIAATLFLSQKTVESHLRNIFAKVGVGSRTALAALVSRTGD